MTISLVLFAACAALGETALPPELAFLEQKAGDEVALVDAVRAYDRTQNAMAGFELKFATQYVKQGNAEKAKELRERARGRYDLLRKAYEFAVRRYPKNARAKNYYGELLYDHFDQQDAALKAWQEATVLDSAFSPPYNNLGVHYTHIGEYRLGVQYYDQAIEREPDNPDYLYNLTQTYLINSPQVAEIKGWTKEKVFAEALRLSKHATEVQPNDLELAQDYAVNFFAAENFGVKPDWTEAARAWENVRKIASAPDKVFFAWLNEGRVWLLAQDRDKAAACLQKALEIRPGEGVAKSLLEKARNMEPEKSDKRGKRPSKNPPKKGGAS